MITRRYVACIIQRSIDNCSLQFNKPVIYEFKRRFTSIGEVKVPSTSRVVICGGGVMGASVAYHLALIGWGPETVVVEQNRIGGGTTWHSAGLVGVFKPSLAQVKLTKSSAKLYETMESKGFPCGWKKCGSLNVARTRDRMTMFRRMKAQSVSWNIECELLTPAECKKKCPLLYVDDLFGGIWIAEDGVGDPYKVCTSLLHEATKMGVTVVENCPITKVIQKNYQVTGVETNNGNINCEYFVNCAGFWARDVGQLSEPYIKVPLHAVEHYYLHTKHISELDPLTPVVRDQDGFVYFRENNGRLLAGGFEPVANPAFETRGVPSTTEHRYLAENWDHFHILLEQLLHRIPCLKSVQLDRLCNEPEAFSPDCKWIVGEAPEIQNYYVAAGMKTVGIAAAGGVGQATAEMIVHNDTSFDMYELEVSRFLGLHNNRKFLRDRVKEVPGLHYTVNYPFYEFCTGRNLRMSPVYPKLKEAGAVFGQVMGYERPSWFEESEMHVSHDRDSVGLLKIASAQSFGKPHWFDRVGLEYASCREGIGLSDYSSFTKIDLWSKGNEVVDALQYICSNDVDVPVDSIIHTGMQNENGGYENDCSLARISENRYMMIAPTIQQTRCKVWLKKHLPCNVAMSDVTSMYTALCIMGPFTRTLLSEMTETDLSPKNFPFFTHKTLDIGLANGVRTMNLTHTGELGYVLYIPNEFALHVYTSLIEAGKKYGIRHAGYYATRALRVEKFYAFWGQDLDTRTTPLECGRVWRVKFDKNINFIGRDALLQQRDGGIERKYVQLILDEDFCSDSDLWPWGGEPIYRNGKYVGTCTTTGYGYTFKRQVCLGFVKDIDSNGIARKVTNDFVMSGEYEVDIAGIRFPARVSIHSPILPTKYPDKERDVYRATRDKDKFEEK